MAEIAAQAAVWLWGRFVGAVVEDDDGVVTFEYDPAFRQSGLEISPLRLPLSRAGPITFPELRRVESFSGLPGVLADCLPDRFGNAVIAQYFTRKGEPDKALSPVQKLLYVGNRAMGALEFRPPLERGRKREKEALEIADLVTQARAVVAKRTNVPIADLMRLGSSAGGAKPKALVLWNPKTGALRSGFAHPSRTSPPGPLSRTSPPSPFSTDVERGNDGGEVAAILKFDGVGQLGALDQQAEPFNRIEYAYGRMARAAGIFTTELHLLEDGERRHLLVTRFDRTSPPDRRLHMHTLGGLLHVDYDTPGLCSYEELIRMVLALGLDYRALEETYRRAVFNIVAVNQDDHVKNVSFLMDERGGWHLAPAYDLTFARGKGYTRRHQMTLAGKQDGFTRDDLLSLGRHASVRKSGADVIDAVVAALEQWPDYAKDAGVPAARIKEIEAAFRKL